MKSKPLIFGISGTKLTQEEREFFSSNPIEGFILFARNIESKEQLLFLTTELKEFHNSLIFVDQEGGRVARVKPPIINNIYPAAKYFASLYKYEKTLALKALYANYYLLMQELKFFGIDSPLAPVADLYHSSTHDVIGDRSFGNNIPQVVELCNAAIDAITDAGGIAVVKHVPSHGRAICDSHKTLPIVCNTIDELMNTDFAVFKSVAANPKLEWGMTAHIIFESIDKLRPTTLSKKAISFIRNEIGFKAKLMTDDICMFALHSNLDLSEHDFHSLSRLELPEFKELHSQYINNLVEISLRSLDAGCEYVLHCSGNMKEMQAIYKAV